MAGPVGDQTRMRMVTHCKAGRCFFVLDFILININRIPIYMRITTALHSKISITAKATNISLKIIVLSYEYSN